MDGAFTASSVDGSGGTKDSKSGQLSISPAGVITCIAGCGDGGTFRLVMDAAKTVCAGTQTQGSGGDSIMVMTKKAGVPGAPAGIAPSLAPQAPVAR